MRVAEILYLVPLSFARRKSFRSSTLRMIYVILTLNLPLWTANGRNSFPSHNHSNRTKHALVAVFLLQLIRLSSQTETQKRKSHLHLIQGSSSIRKTETETRKMNKLGHLRFHQPRDDNTNIQSRSMSKMLGIRREKIIVQVWSWNSPTIEIINSLLPRLTSRSNWCRIFSLSLHRSISSPWYKIGFSSTIITVLSIPINAHSFILFFLSEDLFNVFLFLTHTHRFFLPLPLSMMRAICSTRTTFLSSFSLSLSLSPFVVRVRFDYYFLFYSLIATVCETHIDINCSSLSPDIVECIETKEIV